MQRTTYIWKRYMGITALLLCSVLSAMGETTQERYEAYIQRFAKTAQEQQRLYGIPASITLAQGLLESAAGKSELATQANNHFGIKCTSDWNGGSYHYDDDRKQECFRKYRNATESYKDHSLFLKRPRYENLAQIPMDDYKGWAHGLKRCGYATDPGYAQKLIDIIERYDLAQYARLDSNGKHSHKASASQGKAEKKDDVSTSTTSNKEKKSAQESPKKKKNKTSKKATKPNTSTPEPEESSDKVSTHNKKSSMPRIALHSAHEVLRNNGKRYVVAREGDTFQQIAQEFNLYETELRRYNDITDPRFTLQVGDKVYLQKKRTKAASAYKSYRVKKGETIWQIAQDKGIQLQSIYTLNGIREGEDVTVNQLLRLR